MDKTTFISFPGLGIDEFKVGNVAFTLFGHNIMWYGIIITFGIILAFLYVNYRAKHNEHISEDDVLDYAIYLVIFGIIGARLYYVLTRFNSYKDVTLLKTLRNMVAIWEGGLAIYGGIIAGFITLLIISHIKKIKAAKALDMIGPAVMLGQLIGRWGNFFNAEAFGRETNLPWRMGLRDISEQTATCVHPTFLYESLWNLIGFIIINLFYKKKKYDGQIFIMYITWYGFGRMFIEGLRTDSLYVGNFRISQVVGFLCFFFGSALLITFMIVNKITPDDSETPSEAIAAADEAAETVKKTFEESNNPNDTDTAVCDSTDDAGSSDASYDNCQPEDEKTLVPDTEFEIAKDYSAGDSEDD